jgi:hypothetical protein
LTALFACGFEPNERLERVVGSFPGSEELASYVGFAPIQIVAAALVDSLNKREALGEAFYSGALKLVLNVMRFLVQNGARLSLDKPSTRRAGENRHPSFETSGDASIAGDDDVHHHSLRSALKIQMNKDIMKILESSDVLEVQKSWKTLKPAPASTRSVFFTDNKSPLPNSAAPGGSDEKSCAICWKAFGMLVRKHRCRLSRRFVCDECSSQRVIGGNDEHRVSDGQYLLAKAEACRKIAPAQKQAAQPSKAQPSQAGARLARLEEEENDQRDTLFGGIVSSMTNAISGTVEEDSGKTELSQAESISGLSSQLNQTRDALNERGAKLDGLADKSEKLVSASQDFAAMAKELNRKSSQGFFSW